VYSGSSTTAAAAAAAAASSSLSYLSSVIIPFPSIFVADDDVANGRGGKDDGNDADPSPPLAILPNIHIACSRTNESALDSSDTIIGTASACLSNRRCDDEDSGV
jgi:hypothetical protein